MEALIVLAIVGFVIYKIYNILQKMKIDSTSSTKEREEDGEEEEEEEEKLGIGKYYIIRNKFFTRSEAMFFNILKKENNNKYTILSKVRVEDIVSVVKGLEYSERQRGRGYIKSRHLDFVLLENNNIKCAIELDGHSHNSEKQKYSDQVKDEIFEAVGVELHRVRVGENFEKEIRKIIND